MFARNLPVAVVIPELAITLMCCMSATNATMTSKPTPRYPPLTPQAAELINLGLQQRTTAQTAKNDISSRSHTVLTVTLEQRGGSRLLPFPSAADIAKTAGWRSGSRARSKLMLVDLAGSERGKRPTTFSQEGAS